MALLTRIFGIFILFFALGPLGGTGAAMADTHQPRDDSCGFVEALVQGKGAGGVKFLENLAANSPMWSKSSQAKLEPALGSPMGRFDYLDGEIFIIADLGKATREHLVAMRLTTGGTVFFRILYEWDGQRLSFINIKLQADYYDIIEPGGI
ncbi:MAG: hypothetical protein L3J32_07705, partial [Rhizobiaceae bacterium]|nr:hypothetical protein [Rhizobiaceae bacterium]